MYPKIQGGKTFHYIKQKNVLMRIKQTQQAAGPKNSTKLVVWLLGGHGHSRLYPPLYSLATVVNYFQEVFVNPPFTIPDYQICMSSRISNTGLHTDRNCMDIHQKMIKPFPMLEVYGIQKKKHFFS